MVIFWLLAMLLLFALPILLGAAIPEIKLIIALMILLSIYSFVRQFFGDGIITYLLTGAAAYYLLFKHFWVTTTIWWVFIVLGSMAFSALGWFIVGLTRLFHRRRY